MNKMGNSCTPVVRIGASHSTQFDKTTQRSTSAHRYTVTAAGRFGSKRTRVSSTKKNKRARIVHSLQSVAEEVSPSLPQRPAKDEQPSVHSLRLTAEEDSPPLSKWLVKDEQRVTKNELRMHELVAAAKAVEGVEDLSIVLRATARAGLSGTQIRQAKHSLMEECGQRIGLFKGQPNAKFDQQGLFENDADRGIVYSFLEKIIDMKFDGFTGSLHFYTDVSMGLTTYGVKLLGSGTKRARATIDHYDRDYVVRVYKLLMRSLSLACGPAI
jgi:hypothetical protein